MLNEPNASSQRPALIFSTLSQLPWEARHTNIKLLKQLQDSFPGDHWPHNRFAYALAQDNLDWLLANYPETSWRDAVRAVAMAREAVRLAPADPDFHNTLGVAYYRADDYRNAVSELKLAVKMSGGGDGGDWIFLAMAHWQLGEK